MSISHMVTLVKTQPHHWKGYHETKVPIKINSCKIRYTSCKELPKLIHVYSRDHYVDGHKGIQ